MSGDEAVKVHKYIKGRGTPFHLIDPETEGDEFPVSVCQRAAIGSRDYEIIERERPALRSTLCNGCIAHRVY